MRQHRPQLTINRDGKPSGVIGLLIAIALEQGVEKLLDVLAAVNGGDSYGAMHELSLA